MPRSARLGRAIHVLRDRYLPNLDNVPFNAVNGRLCQRLLVDGLRDVAGRRRTIFCINSGRAGAAFLAELLGHSRDVRAYHEPVPRMSGGYLDAVARHGLARTYLRRRVKLIGVNLRLLAMSSAQVYAETNHMFIKTFFDVAMDYYRSPDVIILRRDLRKTLKSFVELGYFSQRTHHWTMWMCDPDGRDAVGEPLAPSSALDQFDRCIAYLLEIEARARRFPLQYPKARVHEVVLEEIVERDGGRQLFEGLDIAWGAGCETALRRVVNTRDTVKRMVGGATSLEYCEERLRDYLARAQALGKRVPEVQL